MRYFERQGNQLIGRSLGETLVITPWGEDSLRVRSRLVQEVDDPRFALLDPTPTQNVEIHIEEERATLRCGKITARIEIQGWHKCMRLTFLGDGGEVLLRETDDGNALALRARKFEPILGGDFALTATFEGQEGEHLYGMGQYQEENLDWKGCTLELAHRNSQASVPFVLSSRGLWLFVAQSRHWRSELWQKPHHLACGIHQAIGLLDHRWGHARADQPELRQGHRFCAHDARIRAGILAM